MVRIFIRSSFDGIGDQGARLGRHLGDELLDGEAVAGALLQQNGPAQQTHLVPPPALGKPVAQQVLDLGAVPAEHCVLVHCVGNGHAELGEPIT